ncbi:MAG: UvrD-helicase domain-containing protein [Bacteroidota bacterium]
MDKNIAITESYLSSVFKLDAQSRKLTLNTINLLSENHKSASLQVHSIDRVKCDPKFRSARVNDDIRMIFVPQGDIFTILYVDHHDQAYDWCEGKSLNKTKFGAEYIYDENLMNNKEDQLKQNEPYEMIEEKSLLKANNIKAKNLIKLGIAEIHAENLINISNEDKYLDYVTIFPSEIQEALLDLASGIKSYETIYNELVDDKYQDTQNSINHKDSKRRFYLVDSLEELQILTDNDSFEKWTLFLHPSQEEIVKKNFNGPALIEGGPGTGKTIVGIHRAIYLSQNVYKSEDGKKILICTFSKKLAKSINEKVEELIRIKGIKNNIDVVGIDSFILSTLNNAYGHIQNVDTQGMQKLITTIYEQLKPKGTKGFYQFEYNEVIEKYNITTESEYLLADRTGTGMPLNEKKRIIVWKFFEVLLNEKRLRGITTFVDRAHKMNSGLIEGSIHAEYDSIIIDEAQDLEPIKLKALCKCVKTKENNIFILSDMNQRIFNLGTWKNKIEINIVGRTQYLSINYRTTKQINDYARYQFIQSEMVNGHIKEYKSIVSGADPLVEGFTTEASQYKFIASKVQDLIKTGRAPNQICIICPTIKESNEIKAVLILSEIVSTLLIDDIIPGKDKGVCICTIMGVKGLEFEVVIIFDYNNIKNYRSIESDSPEIGEYYDKLIECEKYVASTRARDELIVTYLEDGGRS